MIQSFKKSLLVLGVAVVAVTAASAHTYQPEDQGKTVCLASGVWYDVTYVGHKEYQSGTPELTVAEAQQAALDQFQYYFGHPLSYRQVESCSTIAADGSLAPL